MSAVLEYHGYGGALEETTGAEEDIGGYIDRRVGTL